MATDLRTAVRVGAPRASGDEPVADVAPEDGGPPDRGVRRGGEAAQAPARPIGSPPGPTQLLLETLESLQSRLEVGPDPDGEIEVAGGHRGALSFRRNDHGGTMCEKESMCEMEKLLDSAAKLVSIFVLAVFLWFCFI